MDEHERKAVYKETFNTVADGYDGAAMRFFPESAKHLSSYLHLRGNEHILDVATGTGCVALTLAKDLPRGHVTGIDFSAGMLAQAAKKRKAWNIKNVCFVEMEMQAIDFPDNHFDGAVSAFSIFFAEDMEKQLCHIADKVKSGGKIIITSFYQNAFSPLAELFLETIQKYEVEIPPMRWKRVATDEMCVSLFNGTELQDIRSFQKDNGYYLNSAEDWWYIIWNGGFRGLVSQLSENDMKKFKQEHLQEVEGLSSHKGIWLEMNILYTMGTKK